MADQKVRDAAHWLVGQFKSTMTRIGVGVGILFLGTVTAFVVATLRYISKGDADSYVFGEIQPAGIILIASLVPMVVLFVIHWSKIDIFGQGARIIETALSVGVDKLGVLLPEMLKGRSEKKDESESCESCLTAPIDRAMKQIAAAGFWVFVFYYHFVIFGLYKNPAVFLLTIVAVGIFFCYKKAFQPDTTFWRKFMLVSVIEMTLVTIVFVGRAPIKHYGRMMFPEVAAWLDERELKKKIADAIGPDIEKVVLDKVMEAKKEIPVLGKEMRELENKANPTADDRNRIAYINSQLGWIKKGAIEARPLPALPPPPPPPPPVPTCSDNIDNNGNRYIDKDDIGCWAIDPTCVSVDSACVGRCGADDKACRRKCVKTDADCRNRFASLDGGKVQSKYYRYHPEWDEVAPPVVVKDEKKDEKEDRKPTTANKPESGTEKTDDDDGEAAAAMAALKVLRGE